MTNNSSPKPYKSLFVIPDGISPTTYKSVVSGASAAYAIKRDVPTIAEISKYCTAQAKTISKVLSTPEFKSLMRSRGFPFDDVKLTPEQYFAVSIITDPSNRKPLSAKLKSAGITFPQYRAWLKQPHFREYITKISEDMLGEHVQDVHTRVVEKATNGDIQAMKLYYELSGRHDPNKQQLIDLQGIIGLLLEIITRHVMDTKALSAISSDIEKVLNGGSISQFDVKQIAGRDNVMDAIVVEDAPAGNTANTANDVDSGAVGPLMESVFEDL